MSLLKGKEFYLSIDIDGVDPAYAPGVTWPEPGGLTSREIVYLVRKLKKLKGLVGTEIVEVNPEKDINNMTVKLAARLVKELSG